MKWQFTLTSLFLLGFSPLTAQACLTGNPESLAYIRRDNNRCEGLQKRNVSSRLELISLSTGKLTSYPATLNIRVPALGSIPPKVQVQSHYRKYLLDKIDFEYSTNGFVFPLKTTVLTKAGIPSNTLRAIAYINQNGQITYVPVILGGVIGKYNFVVYSSERRIFRTIEIRHNGKALRKESRNTPQQGQIQFTWTYGDAPSGIYELYLKDDQNQPYTFRFQHNPNLL
ncbi:hypothetical protein H1Q63_10220 [Desmonostoc muscorum CCALA 125]|nr:hypothetical protein [Desmonostoc muscorum CCALA 125]